MAFFSHHEQRDAVESAANMCKGLKHEDADKVMDQVPNLVSLLAYQVSYCNFIMHGKILMYHVKMLSNYLLNIFLRGILVLELLILTFRID